MKEGLGLYIHIPFCVKKCDYCDFLSFGGSPKATKDQYIEALCNELMNLGQLFEDKTISTIYIGGGTPSVISMDNFKKLMATVHGSFTINEDAEMTMEMNPGTVNEAQMALYMSLGINRVSMGLQSDDDQQLKTLGRIHSYKDYVETYKMMRRLGMKNMNVDVMFGLSNQSMEAWLHTLDSVIGLEPEHISAYSLIIEEDTVYEEQYDQGILNLPDENVERAMFWATNERLQAAGYGHYEISNYAKEGFESKHNGSYWDLTPYIGAGLGASSYYDGCRYKNITSMEDYIEGKGAISQTRQLEAEASMTRALEEAFFLGLRCMKGVDLMELLEKYGEKAMKPYTEIMNDLVEKALLIRDGSRIKLTKRGIDISNQVMSQFIL